jgi:hypothetical protein
MKKTITLLFACSILCSAPLQAASFAKVTPFSHELLFFGTRSAGMGYADLAIASGPLAVLSNPASMRGLAPYELTFERCNYFSDYDMTTFGLAVEKYGFQLSFCRQQLAETGTYNVESEDESPPGFSHHDRILCTGLATDVVSLTDGSRHFNLALGATWRHYSSEFKDDILSNSSGSGNGASAGLTLELRQDHASSWLALQGAAMVQNIFKGKLDFGTLGERQLPHYFQAGLALTGGLRREGQSESYLEFSLAYSRMGVVDGGDGPGNQASRWGLEISCWDLVDLRTGLSDEHLFFGNGTTWGLGLKTPAHWPVPARVAAGWARIDGEPLRDHFDLFNLTIGADF